MIRTAGIALTKGTARAGACYAVHWRNIGLVVWTARADGESARFAVDHVNLLKRDYPLFSVLHVVEKTAGLPTKEGGDRLVQAGREDSHRVPVVGVFLSEPGVLATMMSAFVRATRTLMRAKLNTIVDHRLDVFVAEFVLQHVAGTGVPITEGELSAVISEARKRAALAT